jgi:hypothetical protein
MSAVDLRTFAGVLASYARLNLANVHRAAMLVRLNHPGMLVAAVFGNDSYTTDGVARREVELLRQQLIDAAIEELAFGLSQDGYTWALLVKADTREMTTQAGKLFRTEMLKGYLDEAVWAAWRSASSADSLDGETFTDHPFTR